ncbi:hypothetical protein LTS18_015043 [Coniosporium uncinatum]|uniref:Uncharacterized protein n=1 Tax=Coniosporium uncinatum TaxID=93489 RepID=A0ACC3D8Q7_9PEZI|nr:hypothetical protein LTS18_015043 [Coniosporium uncinatum]
MCNPEKEYRKKQRAATQAVREQEKKERKEYQQAKTRGLIQTTTPFVGANIVTGHVGLGHHCSECNAAFGPACLAKNHQGFCTVLNKQSGLPCGGRFKIKSQGCQRGHYYRDGYNQWALILKREASGCTLSEKQRGEILAKDAENEEP